VGSTCGGYAAGMKKVTSVNVRMTDELRAELQKLADVNRRTLSDYIRLVLEEHAEDEREKAQEPKRRRPSL
jgi:predicted DNA-binding protein